MEALLQLWASTGISNFQADQVVMMSVGFGLLYLAIKKEFEPLLLLPIGFGAVLSNIPVAGIAEEGGLLSYLYFGIKSGLFPLLIFMGVGAMTDFGPMLANPKTLLLSGIDLLKTHRRPWLHREAKSRSVQPEGTHSIPR